MKIIGNTVGMGLPKPNLMQTDPNKGDFVKGKEEFLKDPNLVGDKGDPFTYEDFTPEQLAALKGEPGYTPVKGMDYFTQEEAQAIAEQAAGMVEIPEGDTVELDTTLTASGKAADAKAVGDALKDKLSKSGGTMTGKIVFPTGDQNVGFANSQDMKIFGYGTFNGAMHMRMGDTQYPFQIRGNGERAKYNDSEIALMGDIPDTYNKAEIDTIMGSYITDIDTLIGGDS